MLSFPRITIEGRVCLVFCGVVHYFGELCQWQQYLSHILVIHHIGGNIWLLSKYFFECNWNLKGKKKSSEAKRGKAHFSFLAEYICVPLSYYCTLFISFIDHTSISLIKSELSGGKNNILLTFESLLLIEHMVVA